MGDFKSNWIRVTSGVPQGSVLGPLLFILFINDLPSRIANLSKIYADDNKILSVVNNHLERDILQNDIDNTTNWTNENCLTLNGDKCKIIHYGSSNNNFEYNLIINNNHTILKSDRHEKDVGIIFTNDLKFSNHIDQIVNKSYRILGLLINTFNQIDLDTYRTLYCSFVRPLLEFAAPVWNPYMQKDIDKLERVQRKATKLAPGLKNLCYEDRLKILRLTTLEERRRRGDLIQIFKIVKGFDVVNWHKPLRFFREQTGHTSSINTRGHHLKFSRDNFKINCRHHFFTNRVANAWNSLPTDCVETNSLDLFKSKIDNLYERYGTYEYNTNRIAREA